MLDKHVVPRLKPSLLLAATKLNRSGITADQTSVAGFVVGMTAIVAVALGFFSLALVLMLLSRLADGLDGELARLSTPTDAGGFLDITLDFFFYAAFPLGFALYDPATNALPAVFLVVSFVGTGSSFLAFSTLAEKRSIANRDFAYKGLYYLDGLAEGTETILCFVLMCLLPHHFATIAWVFGGICMITTVNRIYSGYVTLRK